MLREPVVCGHCRSSFEPPPQFTGGLVNCTRCGRAVEVPGLRDPLWFLLRIGAGALVVGVVWLVGERSDPLLGIAAGIALLAGLWLLARSL